MKILNILKLWPVPCLVFCLYCLYTLVEESYEVLYEKGHVTGPLQFLACVELSRVCPNKTEINLEELGNELYDHFNSSEDYRFKRRSSAFRREFELTLNRTKFGGYLVFNRRVCLISNDQNELKNIGKILSSEAFFAIQIDTFDFVGMESSYHQIDQLIVRKKGRPYSDCDETNSRFRCLNECFRRGFRLARYFYQANETGRILLDYNDKNRTIQESESTCFGECKRENCELVKLISVWKSKGPQTFEAQPVLSTFDFCVQLFGRIFLFVGLFFDQLASIATKITRKLTGSRTRRRKVKVVLFYLNLVIIILSLAYSGYLCAPLVHDYNVEATDQPEREMTRNLIQPKTVYLAICVHVGKYFDYQYQEKTVSELERATNGALNDVLEGIYVSDGGSSFRTDYQVHSKILFKNGARCFSLSIHPNYQTIPSRPKLIVRIKNQTYPSLYVLSEEENLNSNSFWYYDFAFQQRITKRLKSRGRCVDYKAKYGNCTGRQNCLERCIARKFLGRYNKTTWYYGQVIDRDWFSSMEWNTSKLMEILYGDQRIYLDVRRECEVEVPDEKACDETTFEATVGIQPPDPYTKEIDLQFDVVRFSKESVSSGAMALDLLSMQSIFFGFTLLKLFWLVYRFIKPRWRLKNKTGKIIWFLVCLLCSLGCSCNTVRIDDVIINGELVSIEHYERAERIQMPGMVFCLRIDQKLVDRNHLLTGRYLEELTRQMNVESTFESIVYLNESNQWTSFDFRRVERFFLLDMKCFRIEIDQIYNRNKFHFSDDTQVLRVKLNKRNRLVHFMTQSRETAEISKISNLDYNSLNFKMNFKYVITHEASLYKHKDRFGFFRSHFPSFQEGDIDYLRKQLLELQDNEPNWATINLPLRKNNFGLEVNEDRFEQLYLVQKKKNGNRRTNLNYQQIFVANHLKKMFSYSNFESDFSFNLVFLRRVVYYTNEISYATLTLGLINLLSIWLELSVLNLRPYLVRFHECFLVYLYLHLPILLLRKFINALIFCCRCLRKFEPILYERIDSQWKDEEEEDEDAPNESSELDESSVSTSTYQFRLFFLCRLFLKFFNLL